MSSSPSFPLSSLLGERQPDGASSLHQCGASRISEQHLCGNSVLRLRPHHRDRHDAQLSDRRGRSGDAADGWSKQRDLGGSVQGAAAGVLPAYDFGGQHPGNASARRVPDGDRDAGHADRGGGERAQRVPSEGAA